MPEPVGTEALSAVYPGKVGAAETGLRRAIAIARDSGELDRLTWGLMSLGWSLGFAGRVHEALRLFSEAREVSPAGRDADLLELESHVRWFAGDFAGSRSCADEAMAMSEAGLIRRTMALWTSSLSASEAGDKANASRLAVAAQRLDHPGTSCHSYAGATHAGALVRWSDGELLAALAGLRLAANHLLDLGALALAPPVLLDLAELAAKAGDPAAARQAGAQLLTVAAALNTNVSSAMASIAGAWAALTQGSSSRARHLASRSLEQLPAIGFPVLRARAQEILGRAELGHARAKGIASLQEAVAGFNDSGALWRRDRALGALWATTAASVPKPTTRTSMVRWLRSGCALAQEVEGDVGRPFLWPSAAGRTSGEQPLPDSHLREDR